MDSLKFPIRFDSTGVEKLADGSVDYYSQLLSICMRTEPGTHPMSPNFGAYDPAFTTIDKGMFVLNASQFVPEVRITSVDISDQTQSNSPTKVSVAFEIIAGRR